MTAERKTLHRNLVAFAIAKPPWVIFVTFLGVFAIGFFMLGYYVNHNDDIVDSEATRGWNDLYSNLSSLVFCLNQTSSQEYRNTALASYDFQNFEIVNVSMPFQLTSMPFQGSMPMNASNLQGVIPYFFFKFGHHILHATNVWIDFESNALFGHCIVDENEETSKCREMTYSACVTVALPNVILPLMKPQACNFTTESHQPSRIYVAGRKDLDDLKSSHCKEKEIEMTLSRLQGYSSKVLLSLAEKTHLNLRLQLASYILFVVFLSFVLYAALKGRPFKF